MLDSQELEQRLERWSNWARSPQIGSTGSTVGYLKERLDKAHDIDMNDEIAITERAVARTKMEDKAYWRVIARYYLGRLSCIEIALTFHVSEHGIKRLLLEAKGRIGDHIATMEQIH